MKRQQLSAKKSTIYRVTHRWEFHLYLIKDSISQEGKDRVTGQKTNKVGFPPDSLDQSKFQQDQMLNVKIWKKCFIISKGKAFPSKAQTQKSKRNYITGNIKIGNFFSAQEKIP